MNCQLCGSQNCSGLCRQAMYSAQAQMSNQQALQSMFSTGIRNITPTPEDKFMQLIDGKSDEEIVLAFEMIMADIQKANDELICKLKENNKQKQDTDRDNFLSMCKRFRPSITEKLVERIGKLKAFW